MKKVIKIVLAVLGILILTYTCFRGFIFVDSRLYSTNIDGLQYA